MLQESNRVEFKTVLNDKLEKEIVAFLNNREGGIFYIGIDNTRCPVESSDIDFVQLKIADRIKNNILPSTLELFDIVTEIIEGIAVTKAIISSGLEKPYYIKSKGMSPSGCYMRLGTSTQPMPIALIVDQIFIGQGVVYLGNAATNDSYPFSTICLAISLLIGIGSASRLSLYLGNKEPESAARAAGNGISMMVIFGIIYLIIGESFLNQLLKLFGVTKVVLPLRFGIMGVLLAGPIADFTAFMLSVLLAAIELRKQKVMAQNQG